MSVFDRWRSAGLWQSGFACWKILPNLPGGPSTMKQALIVIDVQESFRRRRYFSEQDLPPFLGNVQSLIDRCQSQGIPTVQVFHQEPGEDADNPFTAASGCVRAMRELKLRPAAVFHKSVHSAMFGRTAEGTT